MTMRVRCWLLLIGSCGAALGAAAPVFAQAPSLDECLVLTLGARDEAEHRRWREALFPREAPVRLLSLPDGDLPRWRLLYRLNRAAVLDALRRAGKRYLLTLEAQWNDGSSASFFERRISLVEGRMSAALLEIRGIGAREIGETLRFSSDDGVSASTIESVLRDWRREFAARLGAREPLVVTIPCDHERFARHFQQALTTALAGRAVVEYRGRYQGRAVYTATPLRADSTDLLADLPRLAPFLLVQRRQALEAALRYVADRDPEYARLSDSTPPKLFWDWSARTPILDGARINEHPLALAVLTDDPSVTHVTWEGQRFPVREGRAEFFVELSEGPNRLELRARDAAGNEAAPLSLSVIRDTSAPLIELSSPANTPFHQFLPREQADLTVTVAGRVIGEDRARFLLEGADFPLDADGRFTHEVRLTHDLTRSLRLEALDDLGNRRELVVTVITDSLPPWVKIKAPADGDWVSGPDIEVTVLVADANLEAVEVAGRRLKVARDQSVLRVRVPVAEGAQVLRVQAFDAVGLRSPVVETRVEVDSVAPGLGRINPGGVPIGGHYPIPDDGVATLRYVVEDRAPLEALVEFQGTMYRFDLRQTPQFRLELPMRERFRVYEATVTAVDRAGNRVSESLSFKRR